MDEFGLASLAAPVAIVGSFALLASQGPPDFSVTAIPPPAVWRSTGGQSSLSKASSSHVFSPCVAKRLLWPGGCGSCRSLARLALTARRPPGLQLREGGEFRLASQAALVAIVGCFALLASQGSPRLFR
eukprot:CAMPEP_0170275434 /NCGR_PEP_ID=MMETSP0116_2-20130129/37697_1 /TAXON_ID=400756 /ORGANISM="Durinskia baltica, Strain CSIRO CS-38" /LENGTH=128 /DNA_ID=CAMNT_0010526697 /DNA_START=215 /DNA_END=599 /DNA_ORIENTATION=+